MGEAIEADVMYAERLVDDLKLMKAHSVPIRDDRISELITWYVGALQKTIDLIWVILSGGISLPRDC